MPCQAEDLADSPEFRERAKVLNGRHLGGLTDSLEELGRLGLTKTSVEIRAHGAAPLFKMFIINGQEAFFGFYPVGRQQLTYRGHDLDVWDLFGKDSILFHHSGNDDSGMGTLYVEQAQTWFDSVWTSISREYVP